MRVGSPRWVAPKDLTAQAGAMADEGMSLVVVEVNDRACGVIGIRDADTQAAAGATLAAPGRAVLTTVPGGHYDYVSGTSMSVALASGIVALALQVDPATDGANLDRVLRSSARVATPAPTLLDAERTVRELAAAKRRAGSRSGAAPSRTTAGTRSTQRSRRITTPSSSSALIAGSPSRLR